MIAGTVYECMRISVTSDAGRVGATVLEGRVRGGGPLQPGRGRAAAKLILGMTAPSRGDVVEPPASLAFAGRWHFRGALGMEFSRRTTADRHHDVD